ncbi:MAG: hypothetical protein IJ217_01760 [Clostridia bacterium]|nr:hypothetical protein [Clostridia bacterium]
MIDLQEVSVFELTAFLIDQIDPRLSEQDCRTLRIKSEPNYILFIAKLKDMTYKLTATQGLATIRVIDSETGKCIGTRKNYEYEWQTFLLQKFGVTYSSQIGEMADFRRSVIG